MLGGCIAFSTQNHFIYWGATSFATNKWLIVVLYSIFTIGFVVIFKQKKHVKGVAVLSPAVGGALVSSAISWFVTHLAVLGYMDALVSAFHSLNPVGGPWIEFFLLLWKSSASDKGWFVDSPYNYTLGGSVYRLDRIIGCSLWLLLFVVGAIVQLKALKAREAQARGFRAESLREAFLQGKE